ncbi:MAG: hydroxymethylglutaryl-CoA lyase [Alphaproteobacteria bacterium]
MWAMPKSVKVVEVGPRDGLQSFPRWIETDVKVAMVDRLSLVGLPVIEVTGFAHPRVIPNLRDAEEVLARIRRRPGTVYRGLVPNARGAERAAGAGVDEMLGLVTVSEAYLRKNQNMTMEQAVEQAGAAFRIADAAGIAFVMAMGASFWCPYEGRIPEEKVLGLLARFRDMGMRRFYLAGSTGMEDPAHVNRLFRKASDRWPDIELGFHVHNMAGIGTANVVAALDGGAVSIEGAICGIGGGMTLPTTIASVGNLPSEDVVHLLNEMGNATGVDTAAMRDASRDVAAMLGIQPRSHLAHSGTRADVMAAGRDNPRHHPI